MTKRTQTTRPQRKTSGKTKEVVVDTTNASTRIPRKDTSPVEPKTENQKKYISAIKNFPLTFATGPAGTGKAQPLDALVLTPTGYVRMDQINIGMDVVGSNGLPTKVNGVYPQGKKLISKISFSDGRSTECCGEHLWKVYCYEWADKWRVLSTEHIQTLLIKSSYKNRLYIQLVSPIDTEDVDLPIHPYVVGSFLGDGCIGEGYALFSTSDSCSVDTLENLLPEGYEFVRRSNYDYSVVKIDRKKFSPNLFVKSLLDLGMGVYSYEKSIPTIYMKGSYRQRLEMLRGLFDTDGTVDKKTGSISFCTTSPRLASQVQELVRSIGGIASISEKQSFFSYLGVKKRGRVSFQVNCRISNPSDVFHLSRKKELASKNTQYSNNLRLKIVNITPVGLKEAQCISVSAEDHLYVTDDYIVTHNTWIATSLAAQALESNQVDKIILTRPAVEAGESLGFLPGELEDKFDPYLWPFRDVLEQRLGKTYFEYLLKKGTIVAKPLAYMRGNTFRDAFVILDEAQNTTPTQMQMFLTRIGQGSTVVVNGDLRQKDVRGISGLEDALKRVLDIPEVKLVEFNKNDIVRSDLVGKIVRAYDR